MRAALPGRHVNDGEYLPGTTAQGVAIREAEDRSFGVVDVGGRCSSVRRSVFR
jgi:hypothetical protein